MALNRSAKAELIKWLKQYNDEIRFSEHLDLFSDQIKITGEISHGRWLSLMVEGAHFDSPELALNFETEFLGVFAFDNVNFYAEGMRNHINSECESNADFLWSEETDDDPSICCNRQLMQAYEDIETDDPIYEDVSNYICESIVNGEIIEGLSSFEKLKVCLPTQEAAINHVSKKRNREEPPVYYVVLMRFETNDADEIRSSLFPLSSAA